MQLGLAVKAPELLNSAREIRRDLTENACFTHRYSQNGKAKHITRREQQSWRRSMLPEEKMVISLCFLHPQNAMHEGDLQQNKDGKLNVLKQGKPHYLFLQSPPQPPPTPPRHRLKMKWKSKKVN